MASSIVHQVPSAMKAWVYEEYGSPEKVLQLKSDVPVPGVGDDQVLIKVEAAALNPVDFKRMLGFFKNTDSHPPVSHSYSSKYQLPKVVN